MGLPSIGFGHANASPTNRGHTSGPAKVAYLSSVDRFPLSYYEWLPSKYVPSQKTPLTVYFHGIGTSTNFIRGGIGGDVIAGSLVDNASTFGSILISLNTRNSAGFYTNTACGGPQAQDVLDAIAHEKSLRNISSVFLVGFSMGTIGVLTAGAHNPGLAQGVAVVAPITDVFSEQAFSPLMRPKIKFDLCGATPGATNDLAEDLYVSMSPLRFTPQSFSGIPLYATAGGQDTEVPNNFSVWPYASANNTIVNSSCFSLSKFGEPVQCTTSFWSLHNSQPNNFSFRFVYEASAAHDPGQLNAADMYSFFFGKLSGGFYQATFPPVLVTKAPTPSSGP